MANDPTLLVAISAAIFATVTVLALTVLKGWAGWLDLRRLELEKRRDGAAPGPHPAARIELADLKERVRKLEAIAAGVDL